MKLKKIVFELNKVINTRIELPLNIRKICLIGENGSGKSTFLHAINKMFNRTSSYIPNYFSLKDHQNIYTVRFPKILKDNFFYKEDFEVSVVSKGHRNVFVSPIFRYELDKSLENLELNYQNLLSVIQEVKLLFLDYCNDKGIDSKKYGTTLNHFLTQDYSYKRKLKDIIESIGSGVLENRYIYNDIHDLYEFEVLAWKLSGGYSRYQPELLNAVFSKFSKTGKIKNDKHLDYFNNSNHTMLLNLNSKIRKYNTAICRFNNVFGSYSKVYKYLNKKVLRNVFLLEHSDRPSDIDKVFDLALNNISEIIYTDIFKKYKRVMKKDGIDYDFYNHLSKLNVLNRDFSNLEKGDFENITEKYLKFDKDYIDNEKVYLDLLRNTLLDNDIIKDFSHNEEYYFKDFYCKPEYDFALDEVEKEINNCFPTNIVPNFEYVEITLKDNRLSMQVNIDKEISFEDLSSGTIWSLQFNLIKNLVGINDILLIDEPALFLHVGAQKNVLKQLLDLKCVVIYTTHTPYLLPMNLAKVSIYETSIKKDLFQLKRLNNKIEEQLINIFGLSRLSNVLADYKREVILHTRAIESFDNLCQDNGVKNDIYPLPGDVDSRIIEKLLQLFSNYKITPTIVVKTKNEFIVNLCGQHNIRIYTINEITYLMRKNKEKVDLSKILKEVM